MNARKRDALLCIGFCVFLGLALLAFLLSPPRAFSPREKRVLSPAPELSWAALASGDFGRRCEDYAADHLPGRDALIGLNARAERLMGLQATEEIYLGESGRLYERPCRPDPAVSRRNMDALNAFADTVGQRVDMLLIPSAGYMLRGDIRGVADPYVDDRLIAEAYALAGEGVRTVELLPDFSREASPEALYYKTDHHWTSLGAYTAYAGYMDLLGRDFPAREDYSVTEERGFYGSTYSRACLWDRPSESLELWDGGGSFTVSFSDREGRFDSLFFPERLKEADKYPVWLDGNHPLVTIQNSSPQAQGKLLVIRDSFANCMGCFLADSYKTVVLADLRYYKQPLSLLCREEGFDDILFVYSIGNFMSDSNIVWLA